MTARFATNEIKRREHDGCADMGPMDFPPIHYYAPRCVACAIEIFRENGEFTRWLVTLQDMTDEGIADLRQTDEWEFWREWLVDLRVAAFHQSSVGPKA